MNKTVNLLLSGHMRCWQKVYPNTYERIISKFNTRIWIETWDTEGYWVSPENDPSGLGVNKYSPVLHKEAIHEVYRPWVLSTNVYSDQASRFEQIAKVFEPYCNEIRPVNVLSPAWLRAKVTGARYTPPPEADITIWMRPDMILDPEITTAIETANPDKVYTLRHRNHTGEGTGDMFLMSRVETVRRISNWLSSPDILMHWTLKHNRFCPHIFMKDACGKDHVELSIGKTLQHTPNGQYKDWKPSA